MPLTNHPISPKNKKIKNNPQINKIVEALSDSDELERNFENNQSQMISNSETKSETNFETKENKNNFVPVGGSIADKEKIDSRKEFFRLMAEKIKDKDLT